ncbi:MAG: 3-dehydroquinate synthase, partial [Polyangiaceae bacterium]
GDASGRPIVAGADLPARLSSLVEQRGTAYAECHLRVATEGMSADDAARQIAMESGRTRVVVPLGLRTYAVELVEDYPGRLTEALEALSPSSVLLVSDGNVRTARGDALARSLGPLRVPVSEVTLAPGEENKTLESIQQIWTVAIRSEVDRGCVVLGFGGGVVGDLAAFAASTLLRGMRIVQSPTTLLAMADASVGGKTGFDLPEGKNLIGSFHQPAAVVADLGHLATLPHRDVVAGLAEILKVALACDAALWDVLERDAEALARGDCGALRPVLRRALELKAQIVRDDEREAGPRVVLNLGHTVGHALEAAGGYVRYRHGEAVAVGLVAECVAAERLGRASGLSSRVRGLLSRMGLPTDVPPAELAAAWSMMTRDKKRLGGDILIPLLQRVGHVQAESIALQDLSRALGVDRG